MQRVSEINLKPLLEILKVNPGVMPVYNCDKCEDTGIIPIPGTNNGEWCECYLNKQFDVKKKIVETLVTKVPDKLLENQIPAAKHYRENKNLFLTGIPGSGKTMLAGYIAAKNLRVIDIFTFDTYAKAIKSKSKFIETDLKENQLIVIDDLDKINLTDYVQEQIFALMNHSNQGRISLIITSNLSLREFAERFYAHYAAAMISRYEKYVQVI